MMKNKRLIITGFGIFLLFMAICTLIAKGIYTSGLPQVTTQTPARNNVGKEIKVSGTVKQGQEYGIYVEAGLRVASISVKNGDIYEAGDALFQIDVEDLKEIISDKELELKKLESQRKENAVNAKSESRTRQSGIERAKEDYDRIEREADLLIERCESALEVSREELKFFEQYLNVSEGTVSSNDYTLQKSRQEELNKYIKNVNDCARALEDARRAKDSSLQTAARAIADAENTAANPYAAAEEINVLDMEAKEKDIEELSSLLSDGGWIFANTAGRVIESRISVGERTQDGASLLYALNTGERIVEAVFTQNQVRYLSLGVPFTMQVQLSSGNSIREDVVLNYMESRPDGGAKGQMEFKNTEIPIGQTAQLSYTWQSETYETCISSRALHREGESERYYVYVAEEYDGILGTEWRVSKESVTVAEQNDRLAAIENAAITSETRIVMAASEELADGDVVRVVQ